MAIAEVIKYEGDNNTFIWKHPCEDFNSSTQLIVHENQEAIFFMNGKALDIFGAGRYTLETENIPILGRMLNKITGDKKPFHCEVYFINKTVQMALKWGTDSKVRFIEPTYGVPLEIGASGEMNMCVVDSKKLLITLVGTTNGIAWNDEGNGFTKSIQNAFRPFVSTVIKANLSSAIKNTGINILEIDEHLVSLSDLLKIKVNEGFEEYGLQIPQFYVTNVVLPENDLNFKRIRDLHAVSLQERVIAAETQINVATAESQATTVAAKRKVEMERQTTETEIARREAERRLIDAQVEAEKIKLSGFAEAEVMKAKGYTEKDVLQADIQKAFAAGLGNMGGSGSGGGSVLPDIIGLGVGMAAAGKIGNTIMDMANGFGTTSPTIEEKPKTIICPKCGNAAPENAKFCLECGAKIEILAENETICPHCGAKTHKGKFCGECGKLLQRVCPKCGSQVPENSKFCLECGEKL